MHRIWKDIGMPISAQQSTAIIHAIRFILAAMSEISILGTGYTPEQIRHPNHP